MRQSVQSTLDGLLRNTLENMRYGACTRENVDFLFSRVAQRNSSTSLAQNKFRHVSVITSLNSYRDKYNELGVKRFAADTGQELQVFHSIDMLKCKNTDNHKKNRKKINNKVCISSVLQNLIWDLEPHTSEHVPGKLMLCKGLPVMLKHNDATELCITKGQEARVVGWKAKAGKNNTECLETVFVELINPPKTVRIPNLPDNVVPINSSKHTIKCTLPDDSVLTIEREQVFILPNFAMTDYASQGKTREVNVVDLSNSKNHQSMYTALSRSSSAENTVIIGTFNIRKITQGISGFLRQEFRELNMLDEVTKLQFEGTLSDQVNGQLRYPILKSYLASTKQMIESNQSWHPMIQYDNTKKIKLNTQLEFLHSVSLHQTYGNVILTKKKHTKTSHKVKTKQTLSKSCSNTDNQLNKLDTQYVDSISSLISNTNTPYVSSKPHINVKHIQGLAWDSHNFSCAYDALFIIIYHIWNGNKDFWSVALSQCSRFMNVLQECFNTVLYDSNLTLVYARDTVRDILNSYDSVKFPFGPVYASIDYLIFTMMASANRSPLAETFLICDQCGFMIQDDVTKLWNITEIINSDNNLVDLTLNISDVLCTNKSYGDCMCPMCEQTTFMSRQLLSLADTNIDLLIISTPTNNIIPDRELIIQSSNAANITHTLKLSGIIYFNSHHFSCRIITSHNNVFNSWYHDGITTGNMCVNEADMFNGTFSDKSLLSVNDAQDARMIYAIYSK
ncbi:hypothetical protein BJ165DRAFT_1352342 [Panaeolus papilionaceus]|nr:hypothetical protein BJ165DRAFT_1352342 [Panaeolus papilionaceus]